VFENLAVANQAEDTDANPSQRYPRASDRSSEPWDIAMSVFASVSPMCRVIRIRASPSVITRLNFERLHPLCAQKDSMKTSRRSSVPRMNLRS
jgi:hypothetical protein